MRTVGFTDKDVTIRSVQRRHFADSAGEWHRCRGSRFGSRHRKSRWIALAVTPIEFQDRSVYREIVNLHSTAETLAKPEKRRAIVAFVRALIEAQRHSGNSRTRPSRASCKP